MATATFATASQTRIVSKIKSEVVIASVNNEEIGLTFTTNTTRLETTNSKANNNTLYAIVGAGTSLNTTVSLYHYGTSSSIGYFTVQGGNVGVNDFIYHIRQITLTFV